MSQAYWETPKYVKVSKYQIDTYSGTANVSIGDFVVYKCTAIIVVRGIKTDGDFPSLTIGFTSDPSKVTPPSFVYETQLASYADGYLTVVSDQLGGYISMLKEESVYLLIGGDGSFNGVHVNMTPEFALEKNNIILKMPRDHA